MPKQETNWTRTDRESNSYHVLEAPERSLSLRVPRNSKGSVSLQLTFAHPMTEKDGRQMGIGAYHLTLGAKPEEHEFAFFGPGQPQVFTKPHMGIIHAKKLIRQLLEENPNPEIAKLLKQRKLWETTFKPKQTILQRLKNALKKKKLNH